MIPFYKEHGFDNIDYIFVGVDTDFYYPKNLERNLKISYIGSYTLSREASCRKMLYPLVERFGKDVHLYGLGWRRNQKVKKATKCGLLNWLKVPDAYSSTKVALGFYYDIGKELGLIHMRPFEALACKTFFVSDMTEGLKRFFSSGEHLIFVEDQDSVVELVSYYLEHDDERERIAERGYRKVASDYTAFHSAKRIIRIN